MSQQTASASDSGRNAASICHVCHKSVVIRQSDGILRVYGPHDNHFPGSGSIPQLSSGSTISQANSLPSSQDHLFDQSADLFDTTSSDDVHNLPARFDPKPFKDKILKRVPRGARDSASASLQRVLQDVARNVEDQNAWGRLFSYAGS